MQKTNLKPWVYGSTVIPIAFNPGTKWGVSRAVASGTPVQALSF